MKQAANYRKNKYSVSERGAVLVVGLIMVLLISIIGVSAIRGSNLQEAMAGNMREHNLAFQAAESALRDGEGVVNPMQKNLPPFNGTNGLFLDKNKIPTGSVIYYTDADWTNTAKAKVTALNIKNVSVQPAYVIEELDVDIAASAASEGSAVDVVGMLVTGDPTPYRVTSKGYGADKNASVKLQTSYNRRYQ